MTNPLLSALNEAGDCRSTFPSPELRREVSCFGRRQDAYDRMLAAALAGDDDAYDAAKAEFWAEGDAS